MPLGAWSDQQILNQLVSGSKWSGSTITYAFAASSASIYTGNGQGGFSALSEAAQLQAERALSLWDDLIAPDMAKVAPGGSYLSSNIEFGMGTSNIGYAHAYFPGGGSVWFNSSYGSGTNNLVAPVIGQHGFVTYIHEIGHALGLEHMGDYNGSDSEGPSSYQDSTVYSVMSYYGPSWGSGSDAGQGQVAWADWVGADGKLYSPQTPMLNDIMAIQAIYGVETTTRTGDTTYGFNSTVTGSASAVFNFSSNKNPILCIFDSDGIDTLDLSGWSTSSAINLAPGSFSSGNSMTYNISIAYSCWIENATGGAGADTITGNVLSNILIGLGGADTLDGLDGDDHIYGGLGNDTINGGGGTDTVYFDALWENLLYLFDSATQTFTFYNGFEVDKVTGVEYFVDANSVIIAAADLAEMSTGMLSVSAVTPSVSEGNSGVKAMTFKAALSAPVDEDVTFNWTLQFGTGASAASASDFAGATSGTVTILAGQSEALITLNVNGDTAYELNESFTLQISNASGGTIITQATASGTILNDDVAPVTVTGNKYANNLGAKNGDDKVYGLGGNDKLYGYGGNDLLDGGAGNDTMYGGTGNDTYIVNSSRDVVVEGANAGTDTVRTSLAAYTLGANVENLVFTGSSAFRGTGNGLANTIKGGANADTLNGLGGADVLWGGAGKDSFNFTTALSDSNVDRIMDFNTAQDTIRLENAIFTALTRTGALATGAFNLGSSASEADDRILFDQATGHLYYDADGFGGTDAVKFATINVAGLTGTLTAADFFVI
ncbi:MAG: M10 family metallopeptidase C-terminal domain-containing protein [Proteobacteria bacterium]|nr:M10 family metallopeptidase C-terminal domain-containing protein [Pseudomonadota bacterium]